MHRLFNPSGLPGTASRRLARLAVLGLLSAGVFGCALVPDVTTSVVIPTPEAMPQDVRDAIELRSTEGLRSDEAYVRQLQADPAAVARGADHGMAFAISEAEVGLVDARARGAEGVAVAATTYGEQVPDEWGGIFIDRPSGVIVVQFTDHLAEHEAALRRVLHPEARFEVRQAKYSIAELQALADTIARDPSWMEDEGLIFTGIGVDQKAGQVLIDVTSEKPDAADIVTAHYGDDRIAVRVDPHMPWTGGWGKVTIDLSGQDGRNPGSGLYCRVASKTPSVYPQGSRTRDNGRCAFQLAATEYDYAITRFTNDGIERIVAQGSFKVRAGADRIVRVQVGP